eukprot:2245368-Pyramimonas_sp.AAC.1
MVFPLIDHPAGGHRPILLLASFARVWERLRRPRLDPSFEATQRHFWAFGAGKSAESCAWAQSVLSEVAHVKDQGILGLDILRDRAYRHGVPKVIVKTMYNLWRCPRLVRLGSAFHPVAYFACSGLPAGDVFNDAFVNAYALESFDAFTIGSKSSLPRDVPEAAADVHRMSKLELKADISDSKAIIIASSQSLARSLAHQLDVRGLPKCTVTSNSLTTGVDFSPGQRRSAKGALQKRRQIFQ